MFFPDPIPGESDSVGPGRGGGGSRNSTGDYDAQVGLGTTDLGLLSFAIL